MRNAPGRCCLLALSLAAVLAPALARVTPAAGTPTGTLVVFVSERLHHHAIPFASVTVRDEQRGAFTDTDGLGWLPKLSAGRHLVQVTFLGYQPSRDSVLVRAHATDTLRVELREIVIREEPYWRSPPVPGLTDTTYKLLPTTPRRRDASTVLVSTPRR